MQLLRLAVDRCFGLNIGLAFAAGTIPRFPGSGCVNGCWILCAGGGMLNSRLAWSSIFVGRRSSYTRAGFDIGQPTHLSHPQGRRSSCTRVEFDIGQPTHLSHPQLIGKGEITPGITADEYISRRKKFLDILPQKSLAILSSAKIKMMTDVVPYTYRQDANYLYMTGCQQPGGLAVFGEDCGLCMFMPENDARGITWDGHIAGIDAALDFFKADAAYPLKKLPDILPKMISKSSRIFHNSQTAIPTYVNLDSFQRAIGCRKVSDVSDLLHGMRLIKSPSEIKLMTDSAAIACQALLHTLCYSNMHRDEGLLAAMVEYQCKLNGAQRMAFNPVVGGGPNATVIHYSRDDQMIKDGDLLLMDVGCEFHGYCSDLTRTWPPSGCYSPTQKELYDLVLQTNKECLKLCLPGACLKHINDYSVERLSKGLKEIGLLKDNSGSSYIKLNPTSIGHYLGMDVHDCSKVSYDRVLEPGIILTIEPGIYVPSSFECSERFHGIGIRIEDEILITDEGHEVLTASMPKEIAHIESLLNNF